MQNQNQKPVLPQVRYHPSIQNPGGPAGPTTTTRTRTRTSQTKPRTKPAPGPQTRPSRRPVQEDGDHTARRDAKGPEPAGPGPDKPEPAGPEPGLGPDVPGPDKPGPDEPEPAGGPRLEDVPLDRTEPLDQQLVEAVEVLTRGQRTNPAWFRWRTNRITASVAHSVARCRFVSGKSRTPPASYLAAITGGARRVQTRAMSWGVQMEAEAVRRYQDLKSRQLGRPVRVRDCGLFLDPRRPWLAASPDGLVLDGQTVLCLEVKCPYKHRDGRLEDACRDRTFCLELDRDQEPGQPPVYRLKTSHSYFTQIQVQLAVTGLTRADLVVFTLRETAVVPVTFDPERWEDTVSKLERFYRDAVLPHVRQRTARDAGRTEL